MEIRTPARAGEEAVRLFTPRPRLALDRRPSQARTYVAFAVWLLGLALGLGGLWKYKLTPGTARSTPLRWPAHSALAVDPGKATLVMFAHPKCPCTRASLTEVRELMSRFAGKVTVYAAFLHPNGTPSDWAHSDSWADAASIAGMTVVNDPGGREADLFGVETSGHVVLYGAEGRLLFSGGVTPERGHVGSSDRLRQLTAALTAATDGRGTARSLEPRFGAVYGCSLKDDPS